MFSSSLASPALPTKWGGSYKTSQLPFLLFPTIQYAHLYHSPVSISSSSPFPASRSSSSGRPPSLACTTRMTQTFEPPETLRDICGGHVPEHILKRAEELGYVVPTDVQRESLPMLLSGRDCIVHAQTGSGKTLAYLLLIFSVVDVRRSALQALVVVPTRELGMQVTKVARTLAAKPTDLEQKACTVMALLDGGTLERHKSWLKADPPVMVVATVRSLCQLIEKRRIKLDSMRVLVIDEVDFIFHSSKQTSSLRKLLTSYSSINNRQTVFASASIPQHNRFLHDCIQQKWMKNDVVHVHVNPVEPMPSCLRHKFVISSKSQKLHILLAILGTDRPKSAIIFTNEQSEKSKKAGDPSPTTTLVEFLKSSFTECSEILLLEEGMNFNARAASLSEVRQGGCLLISTDIAARGVDLPETTHIYNFDLPKKSVDYLHRAGRTGRRPFSDEECIVTSLITSNERFVLERYENELMFQCEEIFLESLSRQH